MAGRWDAAAGVLQPSGARSLPVPRHRVEPRRRVERGRRLARLCGRARLLPDRVVPGAGRGGGDRNPVDALPHAPPPAGGRRRGADADAARGARADRPRDPRHVAAGVERPDLEVPIDRRPAGAGRAHAGDDGAGPRPRGPRGERGKESGRGAQDAGQGRRRDREQAARGRHRAGQRRGRASPGGRRGPAAAAARGGQRGGVLGGTRGADQRLPRGEGETDRARADLRAEGAAPARARRWRRDRPGGAAERRAPRPLGDSRHERAGGAHRRATRDLEPCRRRHGGGPRRRGQRRLPPRGRHMAQEMAGLAVRRPPKEPRVSAIRVLLIDDHPLMREGIAGALGNHPDVALVGEGSDGTEAVALYRQHRPDVVLMDLQMPKVSGIEATIAIRAEFPDAQIIVLTAHHGDVKVVRALKAGAAAYLLKNSLRTELLDAIRSVHAGHRRLSSEVAAEVAEHRTDDALTERELDVLRAVAAGNSNKIVADRLQISEDTVKGHMRSILSKLYANDRTHAVMIALKRGIIDLP